MLLCDFFDASNKLINVLLSDVDMASDNTALLSCLFNVDPHGVKEFSYVMSTQTLNFENGFGWIRLVFILKVPQDYLRHSKQSVLELLVKSDGMV